MDKLASRLRIGEKIWLASGLVGLLFLAVIWHYHQSLQGLIQDHRRLDSVFEARKTHAFAIEIHLSETLKAESNFLIHRRESYAAAVDEHARLLLERTRELAEIDEVSRLTAEDIGRLMETYQGRFHAIADAWRVKGLDHDSGLQGAFRDTAHELEDRAGTFKADRIYLQLLQIRRGEKDLGLRREARYHERVQGLIGQFRDRVRDSELSAEVREALLAEIDRYAVAFDDYARMVLAGEDIRGGRGPFRQSAHRIEATLNAHYVPDLENNILQLRRREKDYLLRGDEKYVGMVEEIAGAIRTQVDASAISDGNKALLTGLVADYERDFQALVEQNKRIGKLAAAMHEAAERVTPLVKRNLEQADRSADSESAQIAQRSRDSTRLNLLIAIGATALGALFIVLITGRIVRPVREMAGLLDRLTHESPSDRIATFPDGRDEINAMAESLNTMADHRANFMHWWMASMNEARTLRELNEAQTDDDRDEACQELRRAALSKVQQLNAIRGQLLGQTDRIEETANQMRKSRHGASAEEAARLEQSVGEIRTLLAVVREPDGQNP